MSTTRRAGDFRLGGWTVSQRLDRVERGDEARHLEPKAMDLLVFLAERAGEVVSKDDIVEAVWEGRIVADSALTRVVADVRRALDDDAHHPRFIETIPKRGYRLIADVGSPKNRPRQPEPRAWSGRRRTTAALLGLLGVVAVVTLVWRTQIGSAPEPAGGETSARKRIVVLPFENLGSPDNRDFTLGITDEITTRLAAAGGLAVISRQSSQQYADSDKDAGEIGAELSVEYILEGSVRWEQNADGSYRVRISPQLIRVADDSHLWADSYDSVLEDVIDMQIEIAQAVLRRLDVTLEPSERSLLIAPRSRDFDAYQAYLTGLAYLRQPDFWSTESMRIITQSWERAVAIDPEFATAQAALAAIHASSYAIGLDRAPERLQRAREVLDRALELDPDLPMAHFARGQYHAARREYDLAVEALQTAALHLPNESEIHRNLGLILRSRGSWEESMEHSVLALELSPRDPRLHASLGFTRMMLHHYDEADDLYRRSLELEQNQNSTYVLKTLNHWLGYGDLEGARQTLEAMPAADHPSALILWWQQEIQERDYWAALDRLRSSPFEMLEDYLHLVPKAHLEAVTLELLGRPQEARTSLESARRLLIRHLEDSPADPRALASLGEVLAALGDRQAAVEAARRAVELTPVRADAVGGAILLESLARVLLLTGDRDAALECLEELLSIPSAISAPLLLLDPRWDPLRGDPRFSQLLADYAPT